MNKIEALGRWNAHAALHSTLEDVTPEDRVLILIEYKDGGNGVRSANLTRAEAVYLMEQRKWKMFAEDGE